MALQGEQPYGYLLRCIHHECALHTVPHYMELYCSAVHQLRRLVKVSVGYQPPPCGPYRELSTFHTYGQYTKVPPERRLVPEEMSPWKHMELACKVHFPKADTVASTIWPMHMDAAEKVASRFSTIAEDRERWITDIESVCKPLCEFDAYLRAFGPPSVAPIQKHLRVATACALLEGARHADTLFAVGVLFGMPAYGDGISEGCPQSSGLFRPVTTPADYSTSELHAGTARPIVREYVHGKLVERRGEPYDSSTVWYGKCRDRITRQAAEALEGCGVSEQQAAWAVHQALSGDKGAIDSLCSGAPSEDARSRLSNLLNCELKSRQEVRSHHMEQPVRDSDFPRMCADKGLGGLSSVRVSRRHCVKQGVKEVDGVMVDSLRVIDDTRRSGGTRAVRLPEKPDLPSFMWMALMAVALARASLRQHGRVPFITCGLDDMKAAFRTVAKALLPMFGFVVFWSFLWGCMVAQRAYGHLFGDRAGVSNFERVSRAAAILACTYGLVLCREYVDDFMCVDLLTGRQSAQTFLRRILRLMGWDTEDRKHKPMGLSNVGLGAQTDLSGLPAHGVAIVEPDLVKLREGLRLLELQQLAGKCRQQEASIVVGKWRWMSQQTRNRIGTAALQPWEQRARGNDSTNEWTPAMTASLEFLRIAFSEEFLPRIHLWVFNERALDEPCIILYSDAEHHFDEATGLHHLTLCWHAYDQADPNKQHASWLEVPQAYMGLFVPRSTYIGQGEEAAAIAAFYSHPALFARRRVIHFVDNVGSLSHLVNGYANAPDSARLVNMFHAALLALDIEWWGEWIPSKANIADMLTRRDRHAEFFTGMAGYDLSMHDFILPPIDESWSDLRHWIGALRARGLDGFREHESEWVVV